jgi:tetratricopeptide (TPR) repeat protein
VYNTQGQWELAITNLSKAVELEPNYTYAYSNRAYSYLNMWELDKAIADYSKAIELDSSYALAYYNRGLAYYNNGQSDLAIADFNKAIQLSDDADLITAAKDRISEIQKIK